MMERMYCLLVVISFMSFQNKKVQEGFFKGDEKDIVIIYIVIVYIKVQRRVKWSSLP